jgi:phospholipid-transporting ATPase
LLLNFLIPISLVIFIEAIKTFSGVFLSLDKKFEDKQTESSCGVLNCSLIEELGVIDFILTDKTGTLTAN